MLYKSSASIKTTYMKNSFIPGNNKVRLNLDLRLIIVALLVVIVGMLITWQPWQRDETGDRTIQVTGQAVIKSEPDEFSFNPQYESTGATKEASLTELKKKTNDLTDKLNELGVTDKQIKSDINQYSLTYNPSDTTKQDTAYTLTLTISVPSKELAQKVQDYLATTTPQGSVTPYATFSESKRLALEQEGRNQATKDARKKADESAKNLGFKVGNVKSVKDGAEFGGGMPMTLEARSTMAVDGAAPAAGTVTSLPVQSGENSFSYSVTVEYYVH